MLLGLTSLLAVAAADILTPPRMSFSVFYLLPVGFSTFYRGPRVGSAFALLAAATWLLGDMYSFQHAETWFHYWNASVRLAFFLIVTWLIGSLRATRTRLQEALVARARALDREVADHRRTGERLVETTARQTAQLESLGRLAAGVAHDFRNELSLIQSYNELGLNGLSREHPGRTALVEVQRACERAARLTARLSAIGRQEVLRPSRVDLNALVDRLRPAIQRAAGDGVEVLVQADPAAGAVLIDAPLLEEALLNLVLNAREAMHGSGLLTVRTGRRVMPIEGGPPSGAWAWVSITDTGEGLSEEVRQHLFEPYFSTRTKGRGSGLGLSVVHGFVTQSGGFITAEGAPGEGATFTMNFPRLQDAVPLPAESQPEAPPVTAARVLLVEDNRQLRQATERVLGRRGMQVNAVADAEEAEVAARETAFDLLLTDIELPGRNGVDLAERLRRDRPGLPVLFLTGAQEAPERERHNGGLVLRKPFTADDLLEAVHRAIRSQPAQDESSGPA